jgi:hypothetical protein
MAMAFTQLAGYGGSLFIFVMSFESVYLNATCEGFNLFLKLEGKCHHETIVSWRLVLWQKRVKQYRNKGG